MKFGKRSQIAPRAALTLLVAIEKIVPRDRWISSGTGVILIAWGIVVMTEVVRIQP